MSTTETTQKKIGDAVALLRTAGWTVEPPTEGGKWGCHVEVFAMPEDFEPDGCVIDDGRPQDCIYAGHIQCKEQCQHWRRITPQSIREARGHD